MKLQFHLPSLIEFVKYDDDDNAVDSRILRAQRPILKVKPIFPHELDSLASIKDLWKNSKRGLHRQPNLYGENLCYNKRRG